MLENSSDISESADLQYWSVALSWLPIATVFGNALVILAVIRERTLKTSTNYLLVSLATADLLVGLLVQPFAIFMTVIRTSFLSRWITGQKLQVDDPELYPPIEVCDFFTMVDVAASTASITNLVAISVERYEALPK